MSCYSLLTLCSLLEQKEIEVQYIKPFKENLKNFLSYQLKYELSNDGKAERLLYRAKREIAKLMNDLEGNEERNYINLSNLNDPEYVNKEENSYVNTEDYEINDEWLISHNIKKEKLLGEVKLIK